LIPVLVEIGDRWERGDIGVAVEHFASQLIQGKIQAIYHSLPLHSGGPKILVGCAPDELHEIGSLMFATLLRDAGYRVEYLGPDIPLDDLALLCRRGKPSHVGDFSHNTRIRGAIGELFWIAGQNKRAPHLWFWWAAFNSIPVSSRWSPGFIWQNAERVGRQCQIIGIFTDFPKIDSTLFSRGLFQ